MSPITLPAPGASLTSGLSGEAAVGTGLSIPPGLESIIEYRGNYLNMRDWADTYLITDIDGVSDPDVRDSREVNPAAHGETAFNSYYGGRTIALTGKIRAQSLDKLRDMQQGLRTMFGDLTTEYPLIFRAKNSDQDVMLYCKKTQPIAMREVQQGYSHTRDFLVTLRASNPRFLSVYTRFAQWTSIYSDTTRYTPINEITNPSFETNTTGWAGNSSSGFSVAPVISRVAAAFGQGAYAGSIAATNAADGLARVANLRTTEFIPCTPGQRIPFGATSKANTAVDAGANNPGYYVQIDFYDAGQVLIAAGTVATPTVGAGSGNTFDHKGEAIAPANAASYRIQLVSRSTVANDAFDTRWDKVYAGTDSYIDGDMAGYVWNGTAHNAKTWTLTPQGITIASCINDGNFPAQPQLQISGPMIDPTITFINADTNEILGTMIFNGTIATGDTWLVDIAKRKIQDQDGVTQFAALDVASDWPELAPGETNIQLEATGMTAGTSAIACTWRNTWM